MKIGYKEYDEIAIVDPAGKLLVSISDIDEDKISVIEYQNCQPPPLREVEAWKKPSWLA